jgi:HPt (histidine-containing phosphotransfer) domain-containing protein
MHDEDKLRQQMAQIGGRYITRTLGELERIRDLAALVGSGSTSDLNELERAAHKIHGSGAMFGFDQVSDRAGEIEHIAGYLARHDGPDHLLGVSDDDLRGRLGDIVDQLEEVTRAAAQSLGIASNADTNVG